MKMQLHSDETECVFSFFVTVKAAILERKTTPQRLLYTEV